MAANDPNLEWLGHVQPTGLVVAPAILTRHGLVPEEQIRADGDAVAEHLAKTDDGPALLSPWSFFEAILGWQPAQVTGAPGGPTVADELGVHLPDADTTLLPTWAVAEPDGGWQMLVRIEALGIDPDARSKHGWEATPHQRLERLLRETGVPTGLLLTDTHIRLIYAPRGETSGWLAFPLREIATVGGRPMLGALKLLLSDFRLFNDAAERRLPGLLRASRDAQAEVSARLATQVLGALHELLRGLHAADRARIERLAAQRPAHLYEGLLTVLLRLVFLLYAEDRALIPSQTDGPAQALYEEGYGVRALHARLLGDAARYPDTMDERRGAWSRLLALFRLVHAGDISGWIRGRGGKLFNPAVFLFLLGQDAPDAPLDPAPVTDGCILRMLDGLVVLEGERLSYRTLDVEQIGSVYETVMGFTVLAMPGPALAIRAGRNNRTPVFVDLAALAARKPAEREKYLKEEADRSQFPARVKQALAAASGTAALAEALRPIVDERGSPGGHAAPPGTSLLQPTDERRRTGSHYTPRSLTEPIVRHALEPAFERIGEDATPEQVLALKVCDPAMGSGAFLVEACRQLAARLVRAWTRHRGARPDIPPDEDEDLLARRLVAQRCLYGVDRNPMATDLARLSLWLATLARDHEFTFLDHALKTGDSLVGLTARQIGGLRWTDAQSDVAPFDGFLRERVRQVTEGRREIREAPDDVMRAIQEQRHRAVEGWTEQVRLLGDATLAAFFGADRARAREDARRKLGVSASLAPELSWPRVREAGAILAQTAHPVRPFHWELEFPEVFSGAISGFDAIVGSPPFLGGTAISERFGMPYFQYLTSKYEGTKHHCDLVAYFFRRAFSLLCSEGCLGLVASNTISQGDTREGGLLEIVHRGGLISRATRRYPWPGEAAVIVSIIHVVKGGLHAIPVLDGEPVARISCFLLTTEVNETPARLASVPYFSLGSKIYGQGFVFDDHDPKANRLETLPGLRRDEAVASHIKPYIGGEDLNDVSQPAARRFVIDVNDKATEDDLDRMPTLARIIREKVKPERDKLGSNPNNRPLKRYWWRYQAHRPTLYETLASSGFALACSQVSGHLAFTKYPTFMIFAHTTVVIPCNTDHLFGCIQGRTHEVWDRFLASSMKDDLRYTPSDCLQTFPLPEGFIDLRSISAAASDYYNHRTTLMISHNEGLTKTYNRFHDPAERAPDIQRLRELHHAIDVAVLRAYGWDDLADRAAPQFLTEASEPDHRYQGRLFWPAAFRDEVLARLLDLNRARAEEERRLGLSPRGAALPDDPDTDEAARGSRR